MKTQAKSHDDYLLREKQRKLKSFSEYRGAGFAAGFTAGISLLLLCNTYSVSENALSEPMAVIAGIYLFSALVQLIVRRRIGRDILDRGGIRTSTRRIGFAMLLFLLTGNIFIAIGAFDLIKEEKGIEYSLCTYSILTVLVVMFVSMLNLFKDYVSDYFMVGMGLLALVLAFYVAVMILVSRLVRERKVDRRLAPVAVALILTAVTGNLFALVLGLVLLTKIRHSGEHASVEWIDILRRLFRNIMAVLGTFVVVSLVAISVCSFLTFDYSIAIDNNYSALLQKPSLMFPFGTDDYGRCVFTRIVYGARISLSVGMASTAVPIIIGGALGAFSGYYSGKIDNVIMRILDVLYAVPGILLAIAIVASFGANTFNLIIALSIGSIPSYARTVRATVMGLANGEFVEAARACGARDVTIIFKHIIPNSLAPIIVQATLGIGGAVLSTSSLSYLGLGVEPHIPEWGNILKIGSNYLETNPYLAIYPGLAIIVLVLAFNYLGDGLRDALDPRLK